MPRPGHDAESKPIWPPTCGHYAIRVVKHGPEVPAKIECAGAMWAVTILDKTETHDDPAQIRSLDQIWPYGRSITKADYDFLLARYHYCLRHEPHSPFCNPTKPISLAAMPPLMPRGTR